MTSLFIITDKFVQNSNYGRIQMFIALIVGQATYLVENCFKQFVNEMCYQGLFTNWNLGKFSKFKPTVSLEFFFKPNSGKYTWDVYIYRPISF